LPIKTKLKVLLQVSVLRSSLLIALLSAWTLGCAASAPPKVKFEDVMVARADRDESKVKPQSK
jgi:hypothetical protein